MDTKWKANHMTLKCDLNIRFAQPGHQGSAHKLSERNIWVKSN